MADLVHGLGDGLHLIVSGDHEVVHLALGSLRIAFESTGIAALFAIPVACVLGLGDFRGRRALIALANALVRFPPIAVGLIVALLLWPSSTWGGGPLSGLGWLFSINAIVFAQTLIAFPILVSLTTSAVQSASPSLLVQARAFGASPWGVGVLALREARIQVVAAFVAALGVTIGAIGAIILVGGAFVQTSLAPAVLLQWSYGFANARAVAYGTVLLALFLVLAAALTILQQRRSPWLGARAS